MRKTGDITRVRGDLRVGQNYGREMFTEGMEKYRNKDVIIKDVRIEGTRICYVVENDKMEWYFTEEMFA